jgi:hypothetical protein
MYCGDCGMPLKGPGSCPRCRSSHFRELLPGTRWYCYDCEAAVPRNAEKCPRCGAEHRLPRGFEPTMRGMTALLREDRTQGKAKVRVPKTQRVREVAEVPRPSRRAAPTKVPAILWVLLVAGGLWILSLVVESLSDSSSWQDIRPSQATTQKYNDYMKSLQRPMESDDGPYGPTPAERLKQMYP